MVVTTESFFLRQFSNYNQEIDVLIVTALDLVNQSIYETGSVATVLS